MAFLLRASAAARWVRCTAWRLMQAGMPDIGDPTIREEGIAFHWAALMIWLGHQVNVGMIAPNGVSITEEMIDCCDEYLGRIKTWGGRPMLEYEVAAPRIHPECGGTTDAWSFNLNTQTLHIGDAKFGYRFVDPFENWQLLVYANGLIDHIGCVDDTRLWVELSIYQPRAYRKNGPWFVWRVRASDLRAHFNVLRNAADTAMSEFAKCQTGEWCTNCNARVNCDAFDTAVENALEVVGEPINNELSPARTDVELLRIERAMDILDARQTALKARAEMYMRKGVQLPHYNLQSGTSRLRWKDGAEVALQGIASAQGAKLFNSKPITPTQAKKVLNPAVVDALSERPPAALKVTRVDGTQAARVFGES